NVVASCGTALTEQQVRAMRRHSENLTVNFDPDNAGANATERSLQILLDEGMNVRVLSLEGGLDPDEYIKEHGAERYLRRLENASGYFIWMAERARHKFDLRSSEGRMRGFEFLMPAIRKVSDKIERATVVNEVAEYLGIDRSLVVEELRKAAGRKPTSRPETPTTPVLSTRERELLACLLSSCAAREALLPRIQTATCIVRYSTYPILQAIVELHQVNPEFSHSDLEVRLADSSREVLTHLTFSSALDDVDSEGLAERLDRQLAWEEYESYVSDLRSRIRQAERQNNLSEALRLTEEYNALKSRQAHT
ncbi:MAG TPA: toprim domain-containing protein, partial [Bryobacteraceae bacterium]|nr:toprim domain-containing protein [Bryobacteraceae bacterium]